MNVLKSGIRENYSRLMNMRVLGMIVFLFGVTRMVQSQDKLEVGPSVNWKESQMFTSLEEATMARDQGIPIYRIDLSKKRLKQFPSELIPWTEIREINLNQNKITEIDADLRDWIYLEEFSAASNRLTRFPASVLSWRQLKELDLGDNFIDSIPMDLDELSALKNLSLWSNIIGYYPASLGDLPQLEWLDLQLNDMTAEEQDALKSWLPSRVDLQLSPPCRCVFDE